MPHRFFGDRLDLCRGRHVLLVFCPYVHLARPTVFGIPLLRWCIADRWYGFPSIFRFLVHSFTFLSALCIHVAHPKFFHAFFSLYARTHVDVTAHRPSGHGHAVPGSFVTSLRRVALRLPLARTHLVSVLCVLTLSQLAAYLSSLCRFYFLSFFAAALLNGRRDFFSTATDLAYYRRKK